MKVHVILETDFLSMPNQVSLQVFADRASAEAEWANLKAADTTEEDDRLDDRVFSPDEERGYDLFLDVEVK